MALQNPWQPGRPATAATRALNITVIHPPGQALPEGFAQQDWGAATTQRWRLPSCLTADGKCEAALIDLDGDGGAEVLLLAAATSQSGAFKAGPGGKWTWLGVVANAFCREVREAWKAGQWEPVEPRVKEINANGIRLRITPDPGCPR
jgi:hypothetical protein